MISGAQIGFREKKSTNTATQTSTEHIQRALDNKLLGTYSYIQHIADRPFNYLNHPGDW
jgi:hypothetical protein